MPTTHEIRDGIATVVMNHPPVNALTVRGWFELADLVRSLGQRDEVRVVVLAAEGRGFNAGVDIKEMQATEGFDALIGANRGCYAAFAAVYECAVPVIAAVHGFCLGGGIGLVGNADVIVASDDATFGLPEVDRGALGAATHLARLVPQHRMRAMVYTSARATAAELHAYGSVLEVVPRAELMDAARKVAAAIAAKSPVVIRAAKESLNGIDPIDVKRSYRFEQGFTFELNLSGVADQARAAFVEKRDAGFGPGATGGGAAGQGRTEEEVSDKRLTEEQVVARLRSGMTLGIGGWGSRRKPMSLVRAIARSDLTDLTVVSFGGPDVGLLCAVGKVRKVVYGFVSLDSIPLEPHFRKARESGAIEAFELDEGMFQLGLRAAAWRVPFLPCRAGLGSDVLRVNPELRTVRSPYPGPDGGDGEELVAMPALRLDAALVHLNRADVHGNGQYLGPDPYFDDLFCMAADHAYLSCERVVPTEELLAAGPVQTLLVDRMMVSGVVEAPGGAAFTECPPDYPRDEELQKAYAASARDDAAWAEFRARWLDRTSGPEGA